MFENYQIPEQYIPSDPRFGSGPSLIPISFIDALRDTGVHLLGTSHRKPAVKNLVKSVQEGLRKYFEIPDDYSVVVGNGGATFLFDSIASVLIFFYKRRKIGLAFRPSINKFCSSVCLFLNSSLSNPIHEF